MDSQQPLPAWRGARQQIFRHVVVDEGVEALRDKAPAVADLLHDTIAIGRDLIPLIKAGALAIDREVQAAE